MLRAVDGIVSREEVRNQHPTKILQKILHELALTRVCVEVGDFVQVGDCPHATSLALYAHPGFVNVNHAAFAKVFQDHLLDV